MKKAITFSIAVLTTLATSAQLPVSHTPGNKKVLIEEFTGNTCPACPAGAKLVDDIATANPGKTFGIANHAGLISSYTTPYSGATGKDFRVADADAVLSLPGMLGGSSIGIPCGAINREVPPTPLYAGNCLMNSGYWQNFVPTILGQSAYVNIAGQAYLNPNTRVLTVNLEAYYTANSAVSSNKIQIALVQNDIIAYQSNAASYPAMQVGADFRHNHALRDFINVGGPSGEVMTGANTSGTTWTKTFTYTVPAVYGTASGKTIAAVLADLELIVFVSETDKKVINVCKAPITITTSTGVAETANAINFVNVYPNPMANEGAVVFTIAQESTVTINVINVLGQIVISDNLEILNASEHKYSLDAGKLTNGVYFVNVKVGENIITKKISVIK